MCWPDAGHGAALGGSGKGGGRNSLWQERPGLPWGFSGDISLDNA